MPRAARSGCPFQLGLSRSLVLRLGCWASPVIEGRQDALSRHVWLTAARVVGAAVILNNPAPSWVGAASACFSGDRRDNVGVESGG